MRVRSLDADNAGRWDSFVQRHRDGTFFHLAGWRTVIETAFGHRGHYLYVERDGEVRAVLPLVHVSSFLFGNALISTPFCVYGGALGDSEPVNALLDAACDLAKELKVDYLELRNRRRIDRDWPTKDLYVTFRKPIGADEQANLLAVPRKQRAMIRKGIDAGLRSAVDSDLARFYSVYSESVHSLGTPVFGHGYFSRLQAIFGDACEVMSVWHQEQIIASVMSFYFRDEVLPYYGGGTRAARALKGNDFMYWELMRRAGARGIRVFDYGRSKRNTGSFSFKEHWGFAAEPLPYQYFLVNSRKLPDVSPSNPKYRLFVRGWRILPLAVSRIAGPLIARNLG
ncbi:MAG TPA: FemAB family XrtA/PEP-CTERM system-associated protein [Gammaproteobacteria bacterium]|nr:FemAB family XrtA/PEP-CTERM system-associated protein [Gammaproteobacteria bacterium]